MRDKTLGCHENVRMYRIAYSWLRVCKLVDHVGVVQIDPVTTAGPTGAGPQQKSSVPRQK